MESRLRRCGGTPPPGDPYPAQKGGGSASITFSRDYHKSRAVMVGGARPLR